MFSKRLRELRRQKDATQADIAKLCDVSQQAVGRWEHDKNLPNNDKMEILAEYFGVSIDYLLGRTELKKGLLGSVEDMPDGEFRRQVTDADNREQNNTRYWLENLCRMSGNDKALEALSRIKITEGGKVQINGSTDIGNALVQQQIETLIAVLEKSIATPDSDGVIHAEWKPTKE